METKRYLTLLGAAFGFALLATSANAAIVSIDGASFEDPDVTEKNDVDPTGWSSVGHPSYISTVDAATWLDGSGNPYFSTPFGGQGMLAYNGGGTYAYQDVGTVSLNTTYTLTFNVSSAQTSTGEYRADLVAIDGGGIETVLGFIAGDVTSSDMSFSDTVTATPTTNSGETLRIKLWQDPNRVAYQNQTIFDNVELDATAVPEPSSFALLAGCFGLAWVMVRRRG